MKKEQIQENGISRRGFLKRTALAGAAICIAPALEKVTAAEKAITGKSSVSAATIPAGMAAVRAQRTLSSGKAAFTISAMGFGCMGLNHHRSQSPDEKTCIRLIHEAIERGVTLFDTAESYGYHKNEKLVGEALKGYTDRVFVSSKFGHKFVNGVQVKTEEDSTPTNIRRVCENSLRNLGVETLGIFYQHRVDPATPIEVVAETCGELIREGKILHWGMCEVNAETIRRAHKVCPVTAIQSEYHFMHRAVEENGVVFTISFPQRCEGRNLFIKNAIDSGMLGEITLLRVRNCHDGALRGWLPDYWYDPETTGGGAMMDLGAHPMYLARWMLGAPKRIQSMFNDRTRHPVEDNSVSTIEFANKAIAISETSLVSPMTPQIFEVYGTKGVILATGDYASDYDMCADLCPWVVGTHNYYNPNYNTGDGHKMVVWAGGKIEDGPHTKMLHDFDAGPASMADMPFLALKDNGERFCDEATTPMSLMCNYLRGSEDCGWYTQVFDNDYLTATEGWPGKAVDEEAMQNYMPEVDSEKVGVLPYYTHTYKADTLEELAAKLEVTDVDAFVASVARYNELCDGGEDLDFGKKPEDLQRVEKAPFYAIQITPNTNDSFGALAISTNAEVLDADRNPIPGLYSAGEFGSVWCNMYQGGGNLSECVQCARIAGEDMLGL